MSPADLLIPLTLREKYEVHETRPAAAILVHDLYDEWKDISEVLEGFVLTKSDIVARRRKERDLPAAVYRRGWMEREFKVQYVVDGEARQSNTHKVDCFKGQVALGIEWNSKDQTFVRDLNNFRLLFDLGVISVGVIVTRADELQQLFDSLDDAAGRRIGTKYGASTTHRKKLLPRLAAGGGGGCPVLVFAIKRALYDASR